MTNKPMLSVACDFCGSRNEIPAASWGCVTRVEGQCFVCKRPIVWEADDKPAAQHQGEVGGNPREPKRQGEPVAYLHRNTRHTIPALRNKWEPITVASAIAHMQNKALAEEGKEDEWHLGHEFQKCYAEQPAPVAPFKPDTVVCRRYTLEQSPGQNFYHYDAEPVYGSVPVTITELIDMAEAKPVAVVMPELKVIL